MTRTADMNREEIPRGARAFAIARVRGDNRDSADDLVAVEEPLEIRLVYVRERQRRRRRIAVTMRTPGHDVELALGFLYSEGLIRRRSDLRVAAHFGPISEHGSRNVIQVELAPGVTVDLRRAKRNFFASSSCGVCGKATIESVRATADCSPQALPVDSAVIRAAPGRLREAQSVFDATGGLHAAGLFDESGRLISLREDVGRHNALDKLIGGRFLADDLPARGRILVLSGRISFELVQKSAIAGIGAIVAVGAPSSLAIDLARTFGLTLVGFVRENRFNVYAGEVRS